MKTDLRSLTFTEIEDILVSMGEAKFRARQLYPAVFKYDSLDEVTTLSKDLRAKLSQNALLQFLPKYGMIKTPVKHHPRGE